MSLHSLLSLLGVILLAYSALVLYLLFAQSGLLFYPDQPTREIETTPANHGLDFEDITLATRDGLRLHGWYVPALRARGTLLFCHGNAGNISHRIDTVQLFNKLGMNVLIFDYRGYGKSEGKPSEEGTYRDVDAAWHYLLEERQTDPREIIIVGRSLGAAIAADLASRTRPAAVILESAFTSVPDMATRLYPWIPVRWLPVYQYDNKIKVTLITRPLLIVHSREDEIIPFSQGKKLFELASEPKHFLELHGGHNDGFHLSRDTYTRALSVFFNQHL